MAHPYQCILASNAGSLDEFNWTLIGASGPKLVVQSCSGARSTWPKEKEEIAENGQGDEPNGPPGKRLKLSPPEEKAPNFSTMVMSNDSQYLVAITGEDKCIRVFQIDSDCQLQQLSQRCMPRRPSAITLTSDDSTILVADKFGDVYALPLLPSPGEERNAIPTAEPSEAVTEKKFTPAASVLTVHSGRNRKVLEEQMKQAASLPPKPKETMKFKHDLLLGHVSMLTDVIYTTVESPVEGGKPRGYILTSDRDEHIRLSRGPPQAHIIEGFCHGHEQFVSRLCLTKSGLLVSGGGDTDLFVWDWLNSRFLETLSIRDPVFDFLKTNKFESNLPDDKAHFNIAVSGIWNLPNKDSEFDEILVACEGIPALFHFKVTGGKAASSLSHVIAVNANALGVAFIQPRESALQMIVSVDNVHKPASTTELRDEEHASRLQYFSYSQAGGWSSQAGYHKQESDSEVGMEGARKGGDEKAARDILYNVEVLRKRPGAED
ncbi:tRNA methyltransferas-like protein [Delitschia confertaspora ATCC 74209]|uniref:tRNA methyltransferas-like protein n=1 Tax=Delitschia confertaspora ATCC 74209 TaxID=1513339 RepID=A0A9P4MT70_9PLEO|nr:tRNA methyltransferas-like protein [Delitschia confertaspora ATCC 74209]